MSGIIAYTGDKQASPILLDGLRRLEYRGYDSAGIAVIHRRRIRCTKSVGKLSQLEQKLPQNNPGRCGIGHTRWATHGEPNDANAHPHTDLSGRIAVVHNGIIENAAELRMQLVQSGLACVSETDSELLAHMLSAFDGALVDAMRSVLGRVQGTYGIAAIDALTPGTIVVARNGSPIILGIGQGEMLAASDLSALSRHTRELVYLDDGEVAEFNAVNFAVTTLNARPSNKTRKPYHEVTEAHDKGGYAHFLLREIHEQPEVVSRTLGGRLDSRFATAHLGGLNLPARDLLQFRRIKILGCGSAYFAAMTGAHMIEELARLPASAEPAAEFRYRNPIIEPETLYIAASQSGETFDTLAAVREIRRKGGFVLGVVNRVGSSIAHEVDGGIYMHAGPEVSVATTKAYTSMLTVFSLLALMLGRLRDVSPQRGTALIRAMGNLPTELKTTLALEPAIATIAPLLARATSAFLFGRTSAFPIALEGAQKLREISYIHAEAYPSSELKHGPLTLLHAATPCIVILQDNDLLDTSLVTLDEIKALGAPLIAISDSSEPRIQRLCDHVINVPAVEPLIKPIVFGVALQLLAYHTALALKRDIDQPRNLAKSVTVE